MIAKSRLDISTPYSNEFFDELEAGMLRSAQVVVPIVLRLIKVAHVLDVGCGRGAWLQTFREMGVRDVRGIDGEYVDRSKLLIPQECFTQADLSKPFELQGRYDLALCLEVAEHLPDEMAPALIEKLVEAAPAVLFSAAIPGQGGTNHINERMPAYWRALFLRHGYSLLDPIRPMILTDTEICWWYRQNIVLYVSKEMLTNAPELAAYGMPENSLGIEWVQADIVDRNAYLLSRQETVRSLCKRLVSALGREFCKKLGVRWMSP